jgi:hypothetical protein
MARSFDLPQYVETTVQFSSAFECPDLPILAMILHMLFQCKPGLSCNVNMSGELDTQETEKLPFDGIGDTKLQVRLLC